MQILMLPDGLAPDEFSASPRAYEGTLELACMPRLAPLLAVAEGEAHVQIETGLDEQGRRTLGGWLETAVPLVCQRCLEVYRHLVSGRFRVVIVASEAQGEALPEELEPYVSGGTVCPLEVVEEEILLALPTIARHPGGTCQPPEHAAGISREALSPFAVLQGRVHRHDPG
ncbi:MAG: YceD family protein [Halorhodospira sp.]